MRPGTCFLAYASVADLTDPGARPMLGYQKRTLEL